MAIAGETDQPPRAVLVVAPTWVGDFVMATPTLRAIRKRFPEARITFLMEPNLRDLAAGGDWMDECIEWPRRGGRRNPSAVSRAVSKKVLLSSSPLIKGGPRGVLRAGKNLPQPLLVKEGSRNRDFLCGKGTSGGLSKNSFPGEDPKETTGQRSLSVPPNDRLVSPASHFDLVRTLRARRFDLAILLPNSFRSALFARLSGARRRIGYRRDGRGWLLTDALPVKNRANGTFTPMPLVEYLADLAESIGCQRPDHRLELFTTPDCEESVDGRLRSLGIAHRHPLVVLSPGAKYGAAKCWPSDRFAEVADRLIDERNAVVVVTCGPGEEPIAQAIGQAAKREPWILDNPRLGLGELKSLIRRCDLLICNDTGPRHFAKALDVPVVTIFGPTHPLWTATDYAAERIVRIDVDCGPCQQRVCPLGHLKCMTGVTVEAVFDAGAGLLARRGARVDMADHESVYG